MGVKCNGSGLVLDTIYVTTFNIYFLGFLAAGMATRKARELKGLEALKRKTSREKEKLTKLLADQLKDDLSGYSHLNV